MQAIDEQLEDENNITKEERNNIYKEMEQLLSSRKKVVDKDRLEFTGKTQKFRFALIFNILVVLVLLFLSGGTYAYFKIQDKQMYTLSSNVDFSKSVLARVLISEAQQKISKRNEEVENIKKELDVQQKLRNEASKTFGKRVEEYYNQLLREMQIELKKLRNKLQNTGISNEEIERQVSKREGELKIENEKKVEAYKKKYGQEVEGFDKKIQLLEKQIDNEKSEIQLLEQTLKQKKEEFDQIAQQGQEKFDQKLNALESSNNKELEAAQNRIDQLKNKRKQHDDALTVIGNMYLTILELFNSKDYQQAKSIRKKLNDFIANSPYKNDAEVLRITSSLDTIEIAIDAITSLTLKNANNNSNENDILDDTLLDKDTLVIKQELLDKHRKYETQKESFKKEQKKLREEIKKEKEYLTAFHKELKRKENSVSLNVVRKEYELLEQKYEALRVDGQKNIQIILNYLLLKKSGQDDNAIKAQIKDLVTKDQYYEVIATILANTLDPSGNLSLQF